MDKTEIWKYLPNESKESIDPWAICSLFFVCLFSNFCAFMLTKTQLQQEKK